MFLNNLKNIGLYFHMLGKAFTKLPKFSVVWRSIFREIEDLGISSLGIVGFVSFFVGGVVVIQMALNLENPLLPKTLIGYATRTSVVLEFSPTLISVILAGKVGSYISSSLGTMKVTEQIDALEVMGINPYGLLVFPKLIASVFFYPLMMIFSIFLGIFGGWVAVNVTGLIQSNDYIEGIRIFFDPYHFTYALIKTAVFAFIISSVPSFYGLQVSGGAIEVGRSSTQAVVWTSVIIIITNYFLTQMLLS